MSDATAAEIQLLPVACIIPGDNDRQRFDARELAELAESIRTNGLAQPITVRLVGPNRFQIVAGERRFRATRDHLGLNVIEAIVRQYSDREASAVMLAENTARADLDPFDEAEGYAKRLGDGWSVAELAKASGKSADTISRRLRLLNSCDETREGVRLGLLPLWAAALFHGLDGDHQRQALKLWQATPRMIERELVDLVSRLAADQDQGALFTMTAETWAAEVIETRAEAERIAPMGAQEIATLLGVSPRTVYSWGQRGQLPPADFQASGVDLWWPETIRAWRASRKRRAA
jgi:ParB/RepB/Spo0J family partition protein